MGQVSENATNKKENPSEDELLELAKQELLRDVKCASMRAEQFGAHSWAKPQKYIPNKRFLKFMLHSASKDQIKEEHRISSWKEKQERLHAEESKRASPKRHKKTSNGKKDKHHSSKNKKEKGKHESHHKHSKHSHRERRSSSGSKRKHKDSHKLKKKHEKIKMQHSK